MVDAKSAQISEKTVDLEPAISNQNDTATSLHPGVDDAGFQRKLTKRYEKFDYM